MKKVKIRKIGETARKNPLRFCALPRRFFSENRKNRENFREKTRERIAFFATKIAKNFARTVSGIFGPFLA